MRMEGSFDFWEKVIYFIQKTCASTVHSMSIVYTCSIFMIDKVELVIFRVHKPS